MNRCFFSPVGQEHCFSRRLIVLWHFDEVIRHNLCRDLLKMKLNDYFVEYLHLMNLHDVSTKDQHLKKTK